MARVPLPDLQLFHEDECNNDPALKSILTSICAELHYIANTLIDEGNYVDALGLMTVVVRTVRIILSDRKPDFKCAIRELKERSKFRPTLRIRGYASDTEE